MKKYDYYVLYYDDNKSMGLCGINAGSEEEAVEKFLDNGWYCKPLGVVKAFDRDLGAGYQFNNVRIERVVTNVVNVDKGAKVKWSVTDGS